MFYCNLNLSDQGCEKFNPFFIFAQAPDEKLNNAFELPFMLTIAIQA
jgi:hypothetical protein